MQYFHDAEGELWEVYHVIAEGRRDLLPMEFRDGWLTFERGQEKRRLAPVPSHWESLSEAELRPLFERAIRAGPVTSGGAT